MARAHPLAPFLCLALVAGPASSCVSPANLDPDPEAIRIGALLPFTGDQAATGANIERSLLWAAEQINAAGGIAGKKVQIVARDTHSNLEHGMQAARTLIDEVGVVALLGPEDEELALALVPLAKERGVVVISGGVTSPRFRYLDDGGFFFRTTPSSLAYASGLAQRMRDDGRARVAVVHADNEFGHGFAQALETEVEALGGTVTGKLAIASSANLAARLRTVLETSPDAVVLAAYPKLGASIVQEAATLGLSLPWYFAPSLRAQVFVEHAPPGALEGAMGVSPLVTSKDTQVFDGDFAARWAGEPPLTAAYFYYDAAALLLLGMASAAKETGGLPPGEQLKGHRARVAFSRGGRDVPWYELSRGLELIARGEDIDYRGVSGLVNLDQHGEVELVKALVQLWTIQSGNIVEREGDTFFATPHPQE